MSYYIYETETFSKLYESMDKEEREWLNKIKVQIKENPNAGKPLKFEWFAKTNPGKLSKQSVAFRWFREKKLGKYRIYYLIYDDLESVFVVGLSGKKDQQKVINTTGLLLDFLRDEIENIIDKEKLT